MKKKIIKGYVIWTRNTTPHEGDSMRVFRHKADAIDHLKFFHKSDDAWRIAPVVCECEYPKKPKSRSLAEFAPKRKVKRGKKAN